jgi:arylsulfatase A-like enzyme
VPWYVPQEFFDKFPLESVQLPKTIENDLDDVPGRGRNIAARSGNYHQHVLAAGKWREAVQGYLASITYADALVGKLLDALENSAHRDNTIIVLWSDHGWQLGEKEHWRKFALWDNVAHVVMMMKVPEAASPNFPQGTIAGSRVNRVTSLMDIFPTLIDLTALPAKDELDGRSLTPLLRDPEAQWDHPAITTYDFDEFSVRTEDFRYIRYIDGGEELYDHRRDAEEWTNLASNPDYAAIKAEMISHIPAHPAPLGPTIELEPHHTPPFGSAEQYEAYIKATEPIER